MRVSSVSSLARTHVRLIPGAVSAGGVACSGMEAGHAVRLASAALRAATERAAISRALAAVKQGIEHNRPWGCCQSIPGVCNERSEPELSQKPPWFTGSGYRHRGRSDSGMPPPLRPHGLAWKKRESSFAECPATPHTPPGSDQSNSATSLRPAGETLPTLATRAHQTRCQSARRRLWRAIRGCPLPWNPPASPGGEVRLYALGMLSEHRSGREGKGTVMNEKQGCQNWGERVLPCKHWSKWVFLSVLGWW